MCSICPLFIILLSLLANHKSWEMTGASLYLDSFTKKPWFDTVQDFLCDLDTKPCRNLLKISVFSLYHVLIRPTKLWTSSSNIAKNWLSMSFFSIKSQWNLFVKNIRLGDQLFYVTFFEVYIFWEGHKILRNLHLTFVLCSASQK